jgi:hypothetical protein
MMTDSITRPAFTDNAKATASRTAVPIRHRGSCARRAARDRSPPGGHSQILAHPKALPLACSCDFD